MAKYVPPSRRERYVPPSSSDLPPNTIQPRGRGDAFRGRGASRGWGGAGRGGHRNGAREGLYEKSDLSRHFGHPQNSTFTFYSYPLLHTPRPPRPAYDPTRTACDSPLPPSPPPPPPLHPLRHLVSYIVIFHNAHPAWETDHEIWTHTNADILIADYQADKTNFGRPIPLFKYDRMNSLYHSFEGWYVLEDLKIVEPHSAELRELLEAKEKDKSEQSHNCAEADYNRGGRSAEAWAASMRDTWIKIKLVPAPPKTAHYEELRDIMSLRGGKEGEVEKYMLQVGGLSDELTILEGSKGAE